MTQKRPVLSSGTLKADYDDDCSIIQKQRELLVDSAQGFILLNGAIFFVGVVWLQSLSALRPTGSIVLDPTTITLPGIQLRERSLRYS